MEIMELKNVLTEARTKYENAKGSGNMIARQRESLRNVLENRLEDILEAVDLAANAEKKIMMLSTEVRDSDRELDEKDAEIKELKERIAELEDVDTGDVDEHGDPVYEYGISEAVAVVPRRQKKKKAEDPGEMTCAGDNGAGDDAGEQ